LFRAPPFQVAQFTLFESRQGGSGPAYIPLADYSLSVEPQHDDEGE
jgi:2'-5' RNA ligase